MTNIIVNGAIKNVEGEMANLQHTLADNVGVMVVMGFMDDTHSKIFIGRKKTVWDQYQSNRRQLSKLALSNDHNDNTVIVMGPYTNCDDIMKSLRESGMFNKSKVWQMKFCPYSPSEAADRIGKVSIANPDTFYNTTKDTSVITKTVRTRKSNPINRNNVIDNQMSSVCESIYVMPSVSLPELTLRQLIKMRMSDFASLTAEQYLDPAGQDIHHVWKLLWSRVSHYLFITSDGTINFSRDYEKKWKNGYRGSMLDYAESLGVLPEVYAVAVGKFYVNGVLPALVKEAEVEVSTEPEVGTLDNGYVFTEGQVRQALTAATTVEPPKPTRTADIFPESYFQQPDKPSALKYDTANSN